MGKFTDFIVQLGNEPKTLHSLHTNPEQAYKDAGLTAAEQTLLRQGDPDAIRLTIAKELGADSSLIKPFYTITISLTTVHVSVSVRE